MNILKKIIICITITTTTVSLVYAGNSAETNNLCPSCLTTKNNGNCPACIINDLEQTVIKVGESLKKAQEIVNLYPEAQSLVRKISQLHTDITQLRDTALSKQLSIGELRALKYQAQALTKQAEDIVNKYILMLFGAV